MTLDRAVTVFLLILSIGYLQIALGYPEDSRLVPVVVGTLGVVIMSFQLLGYLLPVLMPLGASQGSRGKQHTENSSSANRDVTNKFLLAVTWLIAFYLAIYLIGFLVAIPIFLLTFLKTRGEQSWLFSIVSALVGWGITYGFFVEVLHLPLEEGMIIKLLGV